MSDKLARLAKAEELFPGVCVQVLVLRKVAFDGVLLFERPAVGWEIQPTWAPQGRFLPNRPMVAKVSQLRTISPKPEEMAEWDIGHVLIRRGKSGRRAAFMRWDPIGEVVIVINERGTEEVLERSRVIDVFDGLWREELNPLNPIMGDAVERVRSLMGRG